MIYTTTTVHSNAVETFNDALGRALDKFQAQGLVCEVQFSTSSDGYFGRTTYFSALILARKASE